MEGALVGGEGGFAPGGEEGVELVEENGILGKDGKIEKTLRPEKRRGFEGEDGLAETGLRERGGTRRLRTGVRPLR